MLGARSQCGAIQYATALLTNVRLGLGVNILHSSNIFAMLGACNLCGALVGYCLPHEYEARAYVSSTSNLV
jgi:hypothetical protein